MPREARAFHPDGKLPNAGKDRELAQTVEWRVRWRRDHVVKAIEKRLGLGERLSFHAVGHERCGCLRDRAPRALEAGVLDDAVLQTQIYDEPIAAERVVAFRFAPVRDRAEVPRPPVVVEDDLLIELLEIGAHANTSRTRCSAPASTSSSSRVL